VRGHPHELFRQQVRGAEQRAGDRHAEPGSPGPEVGRRRERVLRHHPHVAHLDAEVVGEQLRRDGVLPLSFEREADLRDDLAEQVDGDGGALGHAHHRNADDRVRVPVEHARLDRADDAEPDEPALRARLRLFVAQAAVVAHLEHAVERGFVVPRVVLVAGRNLVREAVAGDEVLAADLRGVDAEFARRDVDQLLEHPVVRRRPHAAVGAGRELVRQHERQVVLGGGDRVAAGERRERLGGADRAGALGRPAEVVDELDAQPRQRAVSLRGERRLVVSIPRLAGAADQVLHAVLDPLDRTPARLAREHRRDAGAARAALAAEAPAVRVADHADLVGGDLQHRGHAEGHVALRLVAAAAGEGALDGVPLRDHAEGLHRVRAEAVPAELLGEDVVGVAERRIDVAPLELPLVDDVRPLLLEDQRRRRRHRGEGVHHRGQRFVLDVDQLERVFRQVAVRRRDRGDGLADEAHLADREAVYAPAVGDRRQRCRPAAGVVARDHGADARERLGAARVDANDPRMGVGAAQDCAMQHPGKDGVVDELDAARDEGRVLDALRRLSDEARFAGRKARDRLLDLVGHQACSAWAFGSRSLRAASFTERRIA
jgi:hypothetical protein